MKRIILEYTTDIYLDDILKYILQENKLRLTFFP